MPSRTLLVIAVLILAVTIPQLMAKREADQSEGNVTSNSPTETQLTAFWNRLTSGDDGQAGATPPGLAAAEATLQENRQLLAGAPVNIHELAGLPGVSLADALRFDVTPAWVAATWPRVTPQRIESGWYGLRVPLVTGTAAEDVAGSLTYYFNAQNYVERIKLHGFTGDPESLISFVQQQYGLQSVTAVGRGMFLSYYNSVPIGILRVEDGAVHSDQSGIARFSVKLELNLPRPGAMLSPDVMDKLRKLRDARLLGP